MILPLILEPVVRIDGQGDGRFGASRGSRTHRGIDFICNPGGFVFAPCYGRVTKLGLPYANSDYRYVEITDALKNRHRLFYVRPLVAVNELITLRQIVGEAQDISLRYPSEEHPMSPHVHYEVISSTGDYLDPTSVA